MGRGDLVDRDPGTDIGPGRLAGLRAGEKCRQGPGMVAGAVPVGLGLLLRQVRVDRELPRHPAERLEGRGEIEAGPDLLRCPILHVDPVGDIQEGNAARGLLGGLASDGTPPRRPGDRAGRDHRFEERKGHGRAGSAEHGASRDRLGHRGASWRGAGGAPAGSIVGCRGPRVNSDTRPGASGGPSPAVDGADPLLSSTACQRRDHLARRESVSVVGPTPVRGRRRWSRFPPPSPRTGRHPLRSRRRSAPRRRHRNTRHPARGRR